MAAIDELRCHADELQRAAGVVVKVTDAGGQIFVLIDKVPLPSGAYRLDATDVLFITDQQYPFSALDMFWTEVDVVKPDGSIPDGAGSIETYPEYSDRQWRRFSWHRNGVWDPTRNGLVDHFAFMEDRFTKDAPT